MFPQRGRIRTDGSRSGGEVGDGMFEPVRSHPGSIGHFGCKLGAVRDPIPSRLRDVLRRQGGHPAWVESFTESMSSSSERGDFPDYEVAKTPKLEIIYLILEHRAATDTVRNADGAGRTEATAQGVGRPSRGGEQFDS